MPPSLAAANDFLSYVNSSPTPFHAVKGARDRLEKAGFKPIKEREPWSSTLQPGGRYYLTRNASSIVAFAIGKKWKAGNPISMIGAHTDSPCLRIKPVSKKQSDGFLQVGVETYGGGLWHTWFDRDLSIAGRVMVKHDGRVEQRLVKVDRPLLRIPTLAIHLDRQENFQFNKETQLFPIAGLVAAELNRQELSETPNKPDGEKAKNDGPFEPLQLPTERHHPFIVQIIADEAGVPVTDVVDFEIVLYDTQKSAVGGLNNELIFSPRLDNLMMSYCSTQAIIKSLEDATALDGDHTIRLIALFDHEEIGSQTAQGADSNLLPSIIRRLSVLPNGNHGSEKSYVHASDTEVDTATAYEQTLSTSFLISADMAHSVHPNYPAKYESSHRPEMNKGTVIKINANARYATNSPGIALLQESARRAKKSSTSTSSTANGVPLQLFVVRNDSSCGSTIGPMLSAAMGVRTLDLGNPQLSMHSIRETGGAHDVEHAINLFESFFAHFSELETKILVD
ncbi:aspartyl aminopeptidase [Pseudovirgaria hyperparasitica]|uniref:aspartyl aminopeptidase n=1 Tax=Pseudovirgaria hyperparasitica TaxID=470096 RepID=A0A6A6W1A0_9PEZI|nr:aspartyl aminopeptidase [Pseudovirgaria hyperparasitica]KAF2756323.1 aspartyl aminopeptidase [Pseudovirgaria hyperparasitica]